MKIIPATLVALTGATALGVLGIQVAQADSPEPLKRDEDAVVLALADDGDDDDHDDTHRDQTRDNTRDEVTRDDTRGDVTRDNTRDDTRDDQTR